MTKLVDSLNKTATTENGALQYQSTGSCCLDFFTKVGSLRNHPDVAYRLFRHALIENRKVALMTLLWAYDCRGGAGERDVFKYIFTNALKDGLLKYGWAHILHHVPEYGRWDMLIDILSNDCVKDKEQIQWYILKTIEKALIQENALCAKWMPRQGYIAERIRNWMNKQKYESTKFTRKSFRQMLVNLSNKGNVVEQKMSANKWNDIEFSKVPSVASTRYAAAFTKHESDRYKQYLEDVKSGKAKMNMTVAFPHEIARMVKGHPDETVIKAANTAYDELTKKISIHDNVLVMADVSGSMLCPVSGSINAIDISVGTAICCADHITGPFKGYVLTFSDDVELVPLRGTFYDKYHRVMHTQNPYGTNFEKAYMTILEVAKRDHLKDEDLPSTLLVVTDMEFNCPSFDNTHIENIKKQYDAFGYHMPKIVFWNLGQRSNGYGMTANIKDCAMISGFSPAILDTVFNGGDIDPISIMLKTVVTPRYDIFNDLL